MLSNADMTDSKTPSEISTALKDSQREHIKRGRRAETDLTLRDAFRYYRPAVTWSVLISLATVMESYDMQIVHSFYAFPQFQERYGVPLESGSYSIPAKWQLALNIVALLGLMSGTFANGWASERFGARRVIIVSLVAQTGFVAITFFAPSIEVLLVGELLCSIPWGFFAAATPSYASEICPLALRGYLTTFVNLCWVMGRLLATGVLTGTLGIPSQWSYRIPFALQWAFPIPLLIITWLAPESPWWLVRKGRVDEAEKALSRTISAPEGIIDTKSIITMIQNTIQVERDMQIGSSYRECFQGSNRRRSEISIVSWGCQLLPGWAIQNYITYFFTLAGLSSGDSFKITLGTISLAFIGTCLSWVLQTHFGRRTIYLSGLIAMLPLMFLVAFLGVAPPSSGIHWAQCALLMVWFFFYGCTIGPIPYAIAAEVGASNLRIKTIALGRGTYYILSVLNSVVAPYMLNPTEGNLKGKAAFPAGVFTVLLLVWTFYRLPETKGMTTETLDHLFHERVPARKFKEEARRFQ
ncbi:general substrate transporter [Aspergillus cavernicola]|uniref:General substrate transporter n=1 Tax=Aspergillus cavernicola TaxID=176166 RepID=A0ABR4I782_9EURO